MTQADGKARPHHYYFAHRALPTAITAPKPDFFVEMGSDRQARFLAFLWKWAGEQAGVPPETDVKDVKVELGMLNDCPTVLLTMPPAEFALEAHMIAIVRQEPPAKPRYFVLERGLDRDGSWKTFVCEWVGQEHQNHGDGPPPSVRDFVAAVREQLGPPLTE